MGNLTRDPELRYTPKGTAVCTFGIATNRSWTPTDGGERQEEAEFHRIVAWSKLAEICSQLLYKGRRVFVEGRLQTRTWQGKDGQERTTTEIVIDNMIALGARKSGEAGEFGGEFPAQAPAGPAMTDDVDQTPQVETDEAKGEGTEAGASDQGTEEKEASGKGGKGAKSETTAKGKAAKGKDKPVKDEGDVADDIPF